MPSRKGKLGPVLGRGKSKKPKKTSTALVRLPRAKVTRKPKVVAAPEKKLTYQPPPELLVQQRDKVVQFLQNIMKHELKDTFDENIMDLVKLTVIGDTMYKGVYWGIGRTLEQMTGKGTYGKEVVKASSQPLGYSPSALYEMCLFYRYYPTIAEVIRLEDAGLVWHGIQWLIKVDIKAVRDKIVDTVIAEQLPRRNITAYIRRKVREFRDVNKPPKTGRTRADKDKADKAKQEEDPTPAGYFEKLESLLESSWLPIKAHLDKLPLMKIQMAEEKQTSDEAYDASIVALAKCRKEVRIWNDNLAVIVRLADGTVENNESP